MEQKQPTTEPTTERKADAKPQYSEPLLVKHETLRDVTGQKYGEKYDIEKEGAEV
jgi:hypothetical protein